MRIEHSFSTAIGLQSRNTIGPATLKFMSPKCMHVMAPSDYTKDLNSTKHLNNLSQNAVASLQNAWFPWNCGAFLTHIVTRSLWRREGERYDCCKVFYAVRLKTNFKIESLEWIPNASVPLYHCPTFITAAEL